MTACLWLWPVCVTATAGVLSLTFLLKWESAAMVYEGKSATQTAAGPGATGRDDVVGRAYPSRRHAAAGQNVVSETASLLHLASAYVERFSAAFTTVVMKEELEQVLTMPAVAVSGSRASGLGPTVTRRRRLDSDFLLIRQEGSPYWYPYRDTSVVDGRPLPARTDSLLELLTGDVTTLRERAEALASESSRFLLPPSQQGTISPLTALSLLQADVVSRFSCQASKPTKRLTRRLSCRESAKPALLQTDSRQDLPLDAEFDVGDGDGSIQWSSLSFGQERERVTVVTYFNRDEQLGVFVPQSFREEHVMADGSRLVTNANYHSQRAFSVTTSEGVR